MIEKAWYVERIAKVLNMLHKDAGAAMTWGAKIGEPPLRQKLEGLSNILREEISWALTAECDEDFTARLQSFLDEVLELWDSLIISNEGSANTDSRVVWVRSNRKSEQEVMGNEDGHDAEDSDPMR
jgi:hypothetical protein